MLWTAAGTVQSAHGQPAPAARYSLPWLLRPAGITTVARVDQTVAAFEDPASGNSGDTWVTSLIGTWKAAPGIGALARVSWVANDPPPGAPSGQAFSNPMLGAVWAGQQDAWRGALLVATTLPIGQGGGDDPDAGQAAAMSAAIPARSAMDNALFAVNYWTAVVGGDVAYVRGNATIQIEATLLRLFRARGPTSQDAARTNYTSGLHAGWFFTPAISAGGEIRWQRWLTDAAPVRANEDARETVTAGVGLRFHFELAGGKWLRPGIHYSFPLDEPLKASSYGMIAVDVPLSF
jgi:hypothetical protein